MLVAVTMFTREDLEVLLTIRLQKEQQQQQNAVFSVDNKSGDMKPYWCLTT